MYFFQKYHDARCSFFTWDNTVLYQQNRHATCVGLGFLGKNPLLVAQQTADVNSLNLGLGSRQPEGFSSLVRLAPKRKVVGWLNQFNFNLDCFCIGLWADLAFAVVHARHEICLDEKVSTPGEITIDKVTRKNVQDAFDQLGVFPQDRKHTGIDDIEIRLGIDYDYCDNNHIGGYLLGTIATGKEFDNARWFQPLVGSRNGGVGFGITADHMLWDDEYEQIECVLMTEFKYQFRFSHSDLRVFDLTNGPLSRFLLATPENNRLDPISATHILKKCVCVEPRHMAEWWVAAHYQWCSWAVEAGYNLFWRDKERICSGPFNFGNFGIFDKTRCFNLTSQSTATIADEFGQGTPDPQFIELSSSDVNLGSAAAKRALSHTFSASIIYNDMYSDWCPWSLSLSALYELPGNRQRLSTLENWGVFGKATVSF